MEDYKPPADEVEDDPGGHDDLLHCDVVEVAG